MGAYLTYDAFKLRTLLVPAEVDYVARAAPGFVETRLTLRSSYIDGRLRKRYGTNGKGGATLPFPAGQVPEVVLGWLVTFVSYDVLRKRGMNPQDPIAEMLTADLKTAEDELKEAADSKDGLWDLPAVEGGQSGVTTGGPLGYSETSPYIAAQIEARIGKAQDGAYFFDDDDLNGARII